MRTFVTLSFVVCLTVAKPQYEYNYGSSTAYQTSGLKQQQQYALAAALQVQYAQPQSYATYPNQDQYSYQSYPTVVVPLQQTVYASQEQTAFASAGQIAEFDQTSYAAPSLAPLQPNAYASASQLQQDSYPTASPSPIEQSSLVSADQAKLHQTQFQDASYATASPSPLEQSSVASASQDQLQQTPFATASPSPFEQSSFINAGQAQLDQTQFQQASFAGSQLPLALPTSATFESGFQSSQAFLPQPEPSPLTIINGLTGFHTQPYQTAVYANGVANDQSQFLTAGRSFAQLQQFSSQLSQAVSQQDVTSGTLDSFNIQSTLGPNPADIALAAPLPSPAPAQQQQLAQQQYEAQVNAQNVAQNHPTQSLAFAEQGSQQQPEQLPQQHPQQQLEPQPHEIPNQSQQIIPEPIQARQKAQQEGPISTIHKHIYVHVPPPEFEEPETLPPAPPVAHNQRYNIIFIKSPNFKRPSIVQKIQNEDKTIVYVLVKKPEEITPIVQSETRHSRPEVFFIKYKVQTKQSTTPIAVEVASNPQEPVSQELIPQEQPQQSENINQQSIVVEDRSKKPSQIPQFPALEGQEAQALLREEEAHQQQQEQPQGVPYKFQAPVLPSPTRTPANTGISPLPIDFAPEPKTASPAPPTPSNSYLPSKF